VTDAIRAFAVEVRERGDAAVASASAVITACSSFQTADGIIPAVDVERVLRELETTDGRAAGEFARRLVAACSDDGCPPLPRTVARLFRRPQAAPAAR
jgi:hypothetical protein